MKKIALILCLLSYSTINATQFFVSSTGTDGIGFGSVSLPYRTIQYAHDNSSPGDTIKIFTGRYAVTTAINLTKSILIKPYLGSVTLDASGWTGSYSHVINIINVNNVRIDSIGICDVIGIGAAGVYIAGSCSNVTLNSLTIRNVGWISNNLVRIPTNTADDNAHAIHVVGDNSTAVSFLKINNCRISNCATGFSEALTLTGNCDNFLVERNEIDSISNIGIDIAGNYFPPAYPGNINPAINRARNGTIRGNKIFHCMSPVKNAAGLYVDGGINVVLEQNLLQFNAVGLSINAEQNIPSGYFVGNVVVRNNVIINNAVSGIITGSSNVSNTVKNISICNNTLFENRTGAAVNGVVYIGTEDTAAFGSIHGGEFHVQNSDSLIVMNNIFHARNSRQNLLILNGYTVNAYKSDYNLYYRNERSVSLEIVNDAAYPFNGSTRGGYFNVNDFRRYFFLDSNSLETSPLYDASSTLGLASSSTSPMRDNGTSIYNPTYSGTVDFEGNRRDIGRVDIGAYEYMFPSGLDQFEMFSPIKLYPVPANSVLRYECKQPVKLVSVYSSAGIKVMKSDSRDGLLDVSNLPSGPYVIVIDYNDGTFGSTIFEVTR